MDNSEHEDYRKYLDLLQSFEQISLRPFQSEYIEKYIQSVFDAENVQYNKFSYWLMKWKGSVLKVKLICSSLQINDSDTFWKYPIKHNRNVDAFLLTAFYDIDSLKIEHIWLILGNEKFKTKFGIREFCDVDMFTLTNNINTIEKMEIYELKEKLEMLKSLMKTEIKSLEKYSDGDIGRILVEKRNDLYMTTGIVLTTREIAEMAIIKGVAKIRDVIK